MKNTLWAVCWLSLLVSLSSRAEEVTTENLLKDSTDTNINDVESSNSSYGMEGAEFTTGNESLGGGSKTFDIDLSEYKNIDLIEYGSNVYSHISNDRVPLCTNTTGDCKDEFKITVSLYNDSVLIKQYNHNYSDISWTGVKDFKYTQSVSDLVFNTAELELYGVDMGYHGGYYGPGFSDYYFTATYKIIELVIDQVLDQAKMDFIDASYDVYEDVSFEIDIQDPTGEMVSFEVDMVEPEMVEINTPVMEEFAAIEEMPTEMEVEMTEMIEELEVEPEVTEESPSEEQPQETATKEEVAQKIMVKVVEQGNQTVLNNVKLAVMAQLADTKSFNNYQLKTLTDNNIDDYLSVTIDDPYGIMFNIAQQQTMDEMINSQWQK